jgi:hypothetical protein
MITNVARSDQEQEKRAHVSHTWPLLSVGFYVLIRAGETDEGSAPAVSQEVRGFAAIGRITGA